MTYDVVIIGAGLAGLNCARQVAAFGAKVLLVDRKHDLTKGIHTTGIFVRKTFEDFTFPADTLGKPVRNVTLYSPRLKALELKSEKEEFRVGKMGPLYEALLAECSTFGVTFSSGTRYVGAQMPQRGSDQIVTVGLEQNGERFEMAAKVLVGADGAISRVAKDLHLAQNREWIVGYEEVYRGIPLDGEPNLHCFLDAEIAPGYLAWITNDGEDVHIGVGGYPAKFDPRAALDLFRKNVAPRFVDMRPAELVETRGGRIPVGGILKKISNRCGLLIGDAAGAVSPLTAGGLDPCLRLSNHAADVICERLRTDDPAVLLRYSGKRFRTRFISRFWMRRLIAVVTHQAFLEAGCTFLRTGPGRKLAGHVFFGRGSFPDIEMRILPVNAGVAKI